MLKLDFICGQDPADIRGWSGLNYFIATQLAAQGFDLQYIFGFTCQPDLELKVRWHWWNLFGKNYQYERSYCYARQMGKQATARLHTEASAIFTTLSSVIPYLQTNKPVFLYNDASFDNLAEYYDHLSRLPASSKRMADKLEKSAFDKAAHLFFASEWAAQNAIEYYGVAAEKVTLVPFGANLFDIPGTDAIFQNIGQELPATWIFLFSGVEFYRKGGPLAVEIVRQLNERGYPSKLLMTGMKDLSDKGLPDFVEDRGFLDKSDPEQMAALKDGYRQAHFFLLPTQKECFGVVFSEAAAYGLPSLAVDTGGVSTAVKHGVSGFLFRPDEGPEAYLRVLLPLMNSLPLYREFRRNTRLHYDRFANWTTSAGKMAGIMTSILQGPSLEKK